MFNLGSVSLEKIVYIVGFLFVTILTGCAGPSYSIGDLKGEYHYNVVQIRMDETAPQIDYCDDYGIAIFDGAGSMTGTGTRKCSISGPATETHTHTYSVNSDGSVLITEVGSTESTRAQIANGGKLLLIDGTTRNPDILVLHGVMVKK